MRTHVLWFLVFDFLFVCVSASAQKNIIIDETLSVNADQYKVKLRSQINDIWKLRFGDYSVTSIAGGGTTTSERSNVTGTKAETKSATEFSFDLAKKELVASVDAANYVNIKSRHGFEILKNFSIGKDEITRASNHFLALININNDTIETWSLLIKSEHDTAVGSKFEGVLTNGLREISLTTASSYKEDKKGRFFEALGYQFNENGVYLGAVQYWGGVLGVNKNIVWITRDLEPKFELVLAAAMTAIIQFRLATMEEIDLSAED